MAKQTVTEPGYYGGRYLTAGEAYDDERLERDGEGASSGVADGPGYDKLTRVELDALAHERGLDVGQARTKDDVISALKADDGKAAPASSVGAAP